MASTSQSGTKSRAPSFYEAAADMTGGAKGAGSAAPGGAASTSTASSSEKVDNVKALLEVFKKMDKIETDADAKSIIQQMADLAEKYMTKIQGAGGTAAGTKSPAAAASSDMSSGMSGAGAGAGATGSPAAPTA